MDVAGQVETIGKNENPAASHEPSASVDSKILHALIPAG